MDSQIDVLLFVESRYKLDRRRLKKSVINELSLQGVKGPAEISVAVVGDRKMKELKKKYKGEEGTANVLSFSQTEGEGVHQASDTLRLGDVVISYPQIIKEASRDEMMVDDKIEELVLHGVHHLLGINH